MSSDAARPDDVRMRGFARRTPVASVIEWLRNGLHMLPSETISVVAAAGRVLAGDVTSRFDIPGFSRAMMDGFALQAADTAGASSYSPLSLTVIGQSLPGHPSTALVTAGCAVQIMTGAPMPSGADAVLPVEHVRMEPPRILALNETTPGRHVSVPGEDIAVGTVVLQQGRRLRPQDLGVLASIGAGEISVVRRPHVRVVVTGNELLPPGSRPQGARIVDSNSPMLSALIERDGGIVHHPGIVPDEPERIAEALAEQADVVLVSGGSSVGLEDHAPRLLALQGELVFHGIAMRPSSPTGIGRLGNRWVFLLPGNPVSCLCAYDFFAGPALRVLGGRSWDWPYRRLSWQTLSQTRLHRWSRRLCARSTAAGRCGTARHQRRIDAQFDNASRWFCHCPGRQRRICRRYRSRRVPVRSVS